MPLVVGHKLDSVKEGITGLQSGRGGRKKMQEQASATHNGHWPDLPLEFCHYSTREPMIISQRLLIL